ncbi:MAG: type II toxin-antitoxin system Phd/YefM family antitoxin [Proteobacteria bacterium]|nr:type II toxin-antitoxin system Phd/YefM family antitoxin [Pseudomonadota bacterium]
MVRLNASEARHDFADVINRVAYRGERIVLHRRGKDVAAIISLEDLELLERLEDDKDLKAAKAALKEAEKKGTKPLTVLMEEMEIER